MAKTQILSFPMRLPDAMQAEALRLLDASRSAINQIIIELFPQLDLFVGDRAGPAWKQVESHLLTRSGHGNRQERCEMEQAGRILRAQASRKQVFQTILPLLSEGLIRPAEEKRPARKDHTQIKEQVRALRTQMHEAGEDVDTFMAMSNLIEQACNRYLQTGAFPTTYEELQATPVLSVGHLTFAGDDGMKAGQTYRARLEIAHFCDLQTRQEHQHASIALRLRTPDEQGKWAWGAWSDAITLPPTIFAYLRQGVGFDWGVRSLITISILEKPEGDEPYRQVSRPVFLDTGGIDGRQARLRREIDRLRACRARYVLAVKQALIAREEQEIPLPAHFPGWQKRVSEYEARIKQCWKTYERCNRELAHLASNVLILLALVYGCRLICGENLTTLKTEGRGRGVRGRFRNWRNNSTVRGELWRTLKYKCHLLGMRARQVEPRGTTHTCPHCHQPAKTFASSAPSDRKKAIKWGAWLCCSNPDCLWNGARDYAASVNIARLGMAFLMTYQETKRYVAYRMADSSVKPALYSSAGATLLLPSQGITPRPSEGKHVYYAGWSYSTSLRTSRPRNLLTVLSTSQFRKYVLQRA